MYTKTEDDLKKLLSEGWIPGVIHSCREPPLEGYTADTVGLRYEPNEPHWIKIHMPCIYCKDFGDCLEGFKKFLLEEAKKKG